MIIVDFSGTVVASVMVQAYLDPDFEINENNIRRSVLSSLKNYRLAHKAQYGDLVVACDGKNYWRKDIFPYYKIKRKEAREESPIDWKKLQEVLEVIKDELRKYTHFAVVETEKAEADDVIATLVQMATDEKDKVLIVSRDKDLKQLQRFPQVNQYNPVDKRWETCDNPEQFLFEHIVKGDVGDSIPNIFSPANSFAIGTRQKPVTKKRMEIQIGLDCQSENDALEGRLELNQKLIDLRFIPDEITWAILAEYEKQINKNKSKLLFYLTSKGLDHLAASMQDF